MLLESGAEVDAKDSQGFRPLNKAIEERRDQVISVLIEHGANTAQQGVLTSAIRSNNDDVANLLLEHGANENVEEMNEALFIMVG